MRGEVLQTSNDFSRLERLAIARHLVKSKPDNISIRDYIISLRSRYTLAYWKEANSELSKQIARLEHENNQLKTELESNRSQRDSSLHPSLLQLLDTLKPRDDPGTMTIEEFEALPEASALTHHLYQLHELSITRKNFNVAELTDTLIELGKLLESQIEAIPKTQLTPPPIRIQTRSTTSASVKDRIHLTISIRLIALLFSIMMSSLKPLTSRDNQNWGTRIIYIFIELFFKTLQCLGVVCRSTAEAAACSAPSVGAVEGPPSKRRRIANLRLKAAEDRRDHLAQEISWLLITMLNITSKHNNHNPPRQILDGMLHIFLTQVGKILNEFVFDEHTDINTTLTQSTASINTSINPKIFQQPHLHPINPLSSERRYLIWILARARTLTSTLNIPSPLLQNTLLRAVFGDNNNHEDENFRFALHVPEVPCPYVPPVGRGGRVDVDVDVDMGARECRSEERMREWYVREVWRLLGWDVLRGVVDRGGGVDLE